MRSEVEDNCRFWSFDKTSSSCFLLVRLSHDLFFLLKIFCFWYLTDGQIKQNTEQKRSKAQTKLQINGAHQTHPWRMESGKNSLNLCKIQHQDWRHEQWRYQQKHQHQCSLSVSIDIDVQYYQASDPTWTEASKYQHVLCWYLESIKSQKHVGLIERRRRGNGSWSDKKLCCGCLDDSYAMTTSFLLTFLLHDE